VAGVLSKACAGTGLFLRHCSPTGCCAAVSLMHETTTCSLRSLLDPCASALHALHALSTQTPYLPLLPCRAAPFPGLAPLLDFYKAAYFLPSCETLVPRTVAIADPSEYYVAQAVVTAGGWAGVCGCQWVHGWVRGHRRWGGRLPVGVWKGRQVGWMDGWMGGYIRQESEAGIGFM